MDLIPFSFEEGLFRYAQVARLGMMAVYTQTHTPSEIVRYETVRLRIQHEHTWPNGRTTPEKEAYPPSTAWGRDGWTHDSLPAAIAQMKALAPEHNADDTEERV